MSAPATEGTLRFLQRLAAAPNGRLYSRLTRASCARARACVRRGWAGFSRTDEWTYNVWITAEGRAVVESLQPPTLESPMPPGHADTSKLKPLTPHARDILRGLLRGPVPVWKVNPGVRSRLVRGGLAESRDRQLHITDLGRVELSSANASTTPSTPSDTRTL